MAQGSDPKAPISPLIHTKICVPRIAKLLSRPRLLDFLHQNIHRKLLLVSAGPGYGKTSLLADFARDTELKVCWYTLDPSDQDLRTFLAYLVESIRVQYPTFGRRSEALLQQGRGVEDQFRAAIGILINELVEEIPEYLVIILDDYHDVDASNQINEVLDTLLQYLPEHVHLIVSGRSVPSLPLTRLAAYGQVAAIGTSHLCFTVEEGQQLFQQNFGLDFSKEQISRLVEDSEGWITALLLKAQAIEQGSMEILTRTRAADKHIYAFLAEEVISRLDSDTQDFVQKSAVPQQFDAAFCNGLLDRRDAAQMLDFLEQRNLFLLALGEGWYRFHSLFREYLLAELSTQKDVFRETQLRAAALWRQRGEFVEAIEHLLHAEAHQDAAREMEALVPELSWKGRQTLLLRWMETLPREIVHEHPRLLLFQGRAYLALGEESRAAECYEQAERLFIERGEQAGWVQTVADQAFLKRMQGAYTEALDMAQEVLAQVGDQEIPAIVDLYRMVGFVLHAQGDLAGAEKHFHEAIRHSLATALPYNQILAYLDLGVCLRAQGRMQETKAVYEQALALSQSIGSPDLTANILNNLAMGPFLQCRFEEAETLLLQALEEAKAALSPRLQALILAGLGDLYRDLGEMARAREYCEQGLQQALRAGHAALVSYIEEALGNLYRQQGDSTQARRWLEEALEVAGSSQRDCARIQVSLALLEVAEKDLRAARERFLKANAVLEEGGWRLERLRARLVDAVIFREMGQEQESIDRTLEAAAAAEEMAVLEPFLAEGELFELLLRGIPSLEGRPGLKPVFDQFKSRACRKQVSAGPSQVLLQVFALGPGQVFSGETEITAKDWGYPLSQELFFYLLLHTPVRKDHIGLAFWPDRNQARVNSAFHNALYQSRRAVGERFVIFEDNVYQWNPTVPVWCDAVEFERLLDQAENPSLDPGQKIRLLQQAIGLYRGPLLERIETDWCSLQREVLARRYLEALLLLGDMLLARNALASAKHNYQRALEADPYREDAYRGLMRCHTQAGEKVWAIRVYQQCQQLLEQELKVEPSQETRDLYQAIVRGGYHSPEKPRPPDRAGTREPKP